MIAGALYLTIVQAPPGMFHPEDIAKPAVFLASDDARFINGHDLIIDGGITAGQPAATMTIPSPHRTDRMRLRGAPAGTLPLPP